MSTETLTVDKDYKPTDKEKDSKILQAIKVLNQIVISKIAPSPIHGVGVFAIKDIKKGEKLNLDGIHHAFDIPYSHFHKLRKEVREILLGHFPLIVEGSHFFYPITKMSAYLNHSDDPNYDAKADVLLRDIKKGEEITEDYRLIKGYEKIFPFLVE